MAIRATSAVPREQLATAVPTRRVSPSRARATTSRVTPPSRYIPSASRQRSDRLGPHVALPRRRDRFRQVGQQAGESEREAPRDEALGRRRFHHRGRDLLLVVDREAGVRTRSAREGSASA